VRFIKRKDFGSEEIGDVVAYQTLGDGQSRLGGTSWALGDPVCVGTSWAIPLGRDKFGNMTPDKQVRSFKFR
jgi:hypothetical protein